jgi:ABC-2 type transport system permease protein
MSLAIFYSFIRASIIRSMRYRFDFVMSLLEGLSMLLINIVFFYTSAQLMAPDDQIDLYLLAPVFQVFVGIFYGLFIDNITGLKYYINRGDLDWMLLKPVNSQVYISLRFINLGHIVSGLLAIPIIVMTTSAYGIVVRFSDWFVACVYILIAVIDGYSLLTTTTSIAIAKTASGNVSGFILPLISMGKYPRRIYDRIGPFMVIALPCLVLCDYSMNAIKGAWHITEVLLHIAIMVGQLWITCKVFRASCCKYKSTGS